MVCRVCGHKYEDGLRVCPECGAASGTRVCAVCGSTMPADAAFCRICGSDGKVAPASGISFKGAPVCDNCGKPLPEGASVCPDCGEPLPKAPRTLAGAFYGVRRWLRRHPIRFRIFCALVVLAALAVTGLFIGLSVRGGRAATNAIALAFDDSLVGAYDGENARFVFADPRGNSFGVDCPGLRSYMSTPDLSAWLLVCSSGEGKATLIRVTRDGGETITTNAWPENVALANSGGGVAYFSDVEDGRGALRLWRPGRDKAARLAEDAICDTPVVISPDGGSVAWVGGYAANDGYNAYLSADGGAAKLLGENIKPFALSDKGDLVYYINDGRVFVRSASGDVELADNVGYSSLSEYYMTSDMRQVLYNRRGSVCISTGGGEGRVITQAWLNGVAVPDSAAPHLAQNGVKLFVCPMKTFKGAVLKLDGALWYYGGEAGILRVAESFDHVFVSSNGLSVIWENEGLLYRIGDLRRSDKFTPAPYYDAGNVTSVTASGRRVWLCNGSKIVLVRKGSFSSVLATAPDAALLAVVRGRLYYTRDDALYSLKTTGRPKLAAERVISARAAAGGLLVRLADGVIYITPEGKTIELYGSSPEQ